jgi:AcrR family transcriptional regulator
MPQASRPSPRPSAARERLLRTARRIFYAEGIHRVGVDRVIAEAEVTRATFYRHFPSKDELVLAYIRAEDEEDRARLGACAAGADAPRDKLWAILEASLPQHRHRGCPFVLAAAEWPEPGSPVHRAVLAHRRWYRETVAGLCDAAGIPDPAGVAQKLLMLRDGATMAAYLEDRDGARGVFVRAAEALVPAGADEERNRG